MVGKTILQLFFPGIIHIYEAIKCELFHNHKDNLKDGKNMECEWTGLPEELGIYPLLIQIHLLIRFNLVCLSVRVVCVHVFLCSSLNIWDMLMFWLKNERYRKWFGSGRSPYNALFWKRVIWRKIAIFKISFQNSPCNSISTF